MSKEITRALPSSKVFLYGGDTKMTFGIPALSKMVEETFNKNPQTGAYIFVSKDRKRVKILYWDGNGYALWYKHVEKGFFMIAKKDAIQNISAINVKALLDVSYKRRGINERKKHKQ